MQPEAAKYLFDILSRADLILTKTEPLNFDAYFRDTTLQAAVERHLEVIGEALNKLRRVDPDTVEKITAYRQIIALRNFLIHAYSDVDQTRIWAIIQRYLPPLRAEVAHLLSQHEDEVR